jgi:hypothetical protein
VEAAASKQHHGGQLAVGKFLDTGYVHTTQHERDVAVDGSGARAR